jgi:predicted aldo/keto reductase-like oxidoreductase
MAYTYDAYNARMARYDLLKAEVQRILKLLQRDRLDFLNIPFMRSALDHDAEYLEKIRYNLENLKKEGLIRFACADTFSGEYTYMQQIESGAFDAIFMNFNFADYCSENQVLPTAQKKGLGVIVREAFMKGELFTMGDEVGFTDRAKLAQIGIKWNLSHEEVTTLVVGADNPVHFVANLAVLDDLALTDDDLEMIDKIKTSNAYKAHEERKTKQFLEQG